MMNVVLWFVKRRWELKRWTEGYTRSERLSLYYKMMNTNLAGCADSATIQVDLQRCLKLESGDFT